MSQDLDLPYVALVPYAVLSDPNLSDAAKIHFGILAGLAKKFGYCWASDDQLAKMKGVNVRQIKRWHEQLEKAGFIKRDTTNHLLPNETHDFKWVKKRKIFVNDGFSKNVTEGDKNVTSDGGDKNVPSIEGDKNVPYKEETDKEEKRKKEKVGLKPSPPPILEGTETIRLSQEELLILEATYQKERLATMIQFLDTQAVQNGKPYKRCFNLLKPHEWPNSKYEKLNPQEKKITELASLPSEEELKKLAEKEKSNADLAKKVVEKLHTKI
jgi:DNA-binding transcriptional regulator YhcF (GntR family)